MHDAWSQNGGAGLRRISLSERLEDLIGAHSTRNSTVLCSFGLRAVVPKLFSCLRERPGAAEPSAFW